MPMLKSKNFIHNSKREMFLFSIGILFFIFSIQNNLIAQWKLIHNFGNYSQYVSSIYFVDNIDTGKYKCFVGFETLAGQTYSELWRTINGGIVWEKVFQAKEFENGLSSIEFKDNQTGWFTLRNGLNRPGLGGCYKTIDGGSTWMKLNLGGASTDDCSSIYYNKSSRRLFLARWNAAPLVSDDEGLSWTPIDPQNAGDFNGFAFNKGNIGFASTVHDGRYFYTSDGGWNWTQLSIDSEAWQPTIINGSFYALSEFGTFGLGRDRGVLLKSTDNGFSWQQISLFPFGVTGTILTDSSRLYIQSTDKGELQINREQGEGVYYSEDSGYTWIKLCGENGLWDTRFYVNKGYVWSGDKLGNLWQNSTGIGSNSAPQLSFPSKSFNAYGCTTFDSAITFTFFDSCNNIQAKLVNASISGSNNFSLIAQSSNPRRIHPNDSVIISYNPNSTSPDTAQLHLRFHLGWKDFDTTIQLFGSGRIPKEQVKFIPSSVNYFADAGSTVDIVYTPNKNISGRGLNSISFDLIYNGDLLDYQGVQNTNPLITVKAGLRTHIGSNETLPVTITGNNISLDSLQAAATIRFMPMVTKSLQTPIIMSNLQLNGRDPNYANCILSADTSNTSFTLNPVCGDSILRHFMSSGKILDIISMHPNPAQDEIEINLQSAAEQTANIEIRNALGACVYSGAKNLVSGSNSIHLDTKNLASGMYLVRIGKVSQSLVISR